MSEAADHSENIPPNYLGILRRRKWIFIVLFPLLLAASIAVALLLSPIYRSTGTIIVETQHIPDDLVRSTITSVASERIQIIKQRVMTREKLLSIVEKYDLFKDNRKSSPVSLLLDELRQNISVDLINANTSKRKKNTATIAFTVAFESDRADIAQAVANDLVSLFLSENVKARTERATETTKFLEQESGKLKKQLDEVEALIADFKQENKDALPEHLNLYMSMLERMQSTLQETERDVKSIEAEKSMLNVQLKAYRSQSNSIETSATPEEALFHQLRDEYAKLSISYLPAHPDLVNLRQKIVSAERDLPLEMRHRVLKEEINKVEIALKEAKISSLIKKSEVRGLEEKLKVLKLRQSELPAIGSQESVGNLSLSEAELEIKTKIVSAQTKIASLNAQKEEQDAKITSLQARIIQIPQVERGLKTLNRDYSNVSQQYDQIKAKEMGARLAESLEEGRKAERFSILEPPLLPDQPSKPNRKKILMFGLIFSIGFPLGLILLKEMLNPGVRGIRALELLTKEAPLAVVPYIETQAELGKKKWLMALSISALVLAIIGGVLGLHFYYKPLDVLWFNVLHRVGM